MKSSPVSARVAGDFFLPQKQPPNQGGIKKTLKATKVKASTKPTPAHYMREAAVYPLVEGRFPKVKD